MKKSLLVLALLLTSCLALDQASAAIIPGSLIKGSGPTIYYAAGDGRRYVFPNAGTYLSWFVDFTSVKNVTDQELATIPLKGNVTYRPGVRLLKIQSDPKVYAVDAKGTLRWLQTEALALKLYGAEWNKNIDDVSDAFFVNYVMGAPIAAESDFSPETAVNQTVTLETGLGLTEVAGAPTSDTKVGRSIPPPAEPRTSDLLPELLPFGPSEFHMDKLSGRTILRFTGKFWNAGDAPHELISKEQTGASAGDGYLDTYQRIAQKGGGYRDVLVGKFLWHAQHDHYHYANFGDYVLQPLNTGSDAKPNTITQKTTFCMRDDDPVMLNASGKPLPRIIGGDCGKYRQVVSVGWADTYRYTLPDQWFDVNDLPAGIYRASFVLDPLRSFIEKNRDNNSAVTFVQIDPKAGTVKVLASGSPFVTSKNSFPDGLLVRVEGTSSVYMIKNGKKRLLRSAEIVASYGQRDVYDMPAGVIAAIPDSRLIRVAGGTAIYVLNEAGYRRRILNPEVFKSYGFAEADVAEVNQAEFTGYPETDLIARQGTDGVYALGARSYVGPLSQLTVFGLDARSVHVVNEVDFKAYAVDVIVKDLTVPWDIVFLPDGDMVLTERPGVLRRYGNSPAVITIPSVKTGGEGGLMGLALHPDFARNELLYIYFTAVDDGQKNRVVRYRLVGNQLTQDKIIIDDIPSAIYHDGGQIAFGPDGMLYLTTGDANSADSAQDLASLAGKTLRLTPDGGIPTDNPFGTAVWSYGHRNAQGIAWDSQGRMWQTEHGRSGAATGYDELNLIEKGKNYGWPTIQGDQQKIGMVAPVRNSGSTVTWAPSGMAYANGSLFFAGLKGATLYEARPNAAGAIIDFQNHFANKFGRLRAVVPGPGHSLYVTTSNKDSRGTPILGDDKVLRINVDFLRQP